MNHALILALLECIFIGRFVYSDESASDRLYAIINSCIGEGKYYGDFSLRYARNVNISKWTISEGGLIAGELYVDSKNKEIISGNYYNWQSADPTIPMGDWRQIDNIENAWSIARDGIGTMVSMRIKNGALTERQYFNVKGRIRILEVKLNDKSTVSEYSIFNTNDSAIFSINAETGYASKCKTLEGARENEIAFVTPLKNVKFDEIPGELRCTGEIMYNFHRATSAIMQFDGIYNAANGVFNCKTGTVIHEPFFYGAADAINGDDDFHEKLRIYHGMSVLDFTTYIKKLYLKGH
jgi:hypothetical protein